MKSLIYLSLALALSIVLMSCKSDTVTNSNGITSLDTSSFKYPFNIGNSWSFTYTINASDIHPDSIIHYFSGYPITRTGSVTILYDTLINGIQTRCFLAAMIDSQSTVQSRSYLINNDTALLMFAQRGWGIFINPPGIVRTGKKYDLDPSIDETITIYDPPFVLLKYPIVTGKTWTRTYGAPTITLTKKYEGYVLITIGAGSFNCMKTSAVYSNIHEPPYFDFYCKFGLLKRTRTFDNVVITNEWFPEGIGTADLTHTFTVNSFNIP